MKNYSYNFEIPTLVAQFMDAFNDIIIKRYDNTGTLLPPTSGNFARFIYAPKQRVFDSLTTPAPGGITMPVVSVSIASISRDPSRVFNKNDGFLVNTNGFFGQQGTTLKVPQPVPVNIAINMVIATKFQQDMEQIISNFVPYCDPYIIISWKLPDSAKGSAPYELRTEVLWNGTINTSYPTELNGSQNQTLVSETSFVIKGWMFKQMSETVKKIYTIDSTYNIEEPSLPITTL